MGFYVCLGQVSGRSLLGTSEMLAEDECSSIPQSRCHGGVDPPGIQRETGFDTNT